MRTLLYQQTNIEIYWDETEKWLYANWIGQQSFDEIKRDSDQMLRLMSARRADSILNDHTNVDGIWVGAAEWCGKDWFPRMRSAGLRNFAWVYSPNRLSQISIDATVQQAPNGIVQVFWDLHEAAQWLRAQRRRRTSITQRIILPPEIPGHGR